MTISVKGLFVTAMALTALLAAYLVGVSGSPPAAHGVLPATDDAVPSLRMSGQGTVTAIPDQLSFTLTATAKRDDLQDALEVSSSAMASAQKTLGSYGVGKPDLATTGLQMQPEYDYPRDGTPILTGYRVTQRARVTVADLSKGGEAIGAVVGSGGSVVTVDNIRLDVSDTDEVLAQARAAAVEDATTKARQYADAAGIELGDIVSIREQASSRPNPVELDAAESARDSAAMPIAPGEQERGVTVEIVWSLAG